MNEEDTIYKLDKALHEPRQSRPFENEIIGTNLVPQSSMILPADHVLRAVINARLPDPLLLLVCFWSYLFHVVTLPYQVGDVPLT
ncbi:hypothetical protein Tco_1192433 [Tanacetum coccineum]